MTDNLKHFVADADAMTALGARLADALRGHGACVGLDGELGAGKTTLVRGLLRGLGYKGPVTSPTYTLMEEYSTAAGLVIHLDLYRLSDPGELEFLGLRDRLSEAPLLLLEWGERGGDLVPRSDLEVRIDYQGTSRLVTLLAASELGRRVCDEFSERLPASSPVRPDLSA